MGKDIWEIYNFFTLIRILEHSKIIRDAVHMHHCAAWYKGKEDTCTKFWKDLQGPLSTSLLRSSSIPGWILKMQQKLIRDLKRLFKDPLILEWTMNIIEDIICNSLKILNILKLIYCRTPKWRLDIHHFTYSCLSFGKKKNDFTDYDIDMFDLLILD